MNTAYESVVKSMLEFDAATLYEAAGRRGMVDPSIRPAWAGARMCGVALTAECAPADNLMLHHAVAASSPGVVIVATLGGCMQTGAWGEILMTAALTKGVAGLAVDGAVRDIEAIAAQGFPVFSRGLAVGACTKEKVGGLNAPIVFGGVLVRPGDLIFGAAEGLVVIERERIEEVYRSAEERRNKEAVIIEQLRRGKTTVEVLGLPPLKGSAK